MTEINTRSTKIDNDTATTITSSTCYKGGEIEKATKSGRPARTRDTNSNSKGRDKSVGERKKGRRRRCYLSSLDAHPCCATAVTHGPGVIVAGVLREGRSVAVRRSGTSTSTSTTSGGGGRARRDCWRRRVGQRDVCCPCFLFLPNHEAADSSEHGHERGEDSRKDAAGVAAVVERTGRDGRCGDARTHRRDRDVTAASRARTTSTATGAASAATAAVCAAAGIAAAASGATSRGTTSSSTALRGLAA